MFRRALRTGWSSVRANAVPTVVLWLVAVLTVAAYYGVPCIQDRLELLREWQRQNGWIGPFLNRVLFCGLIPGVFLLCIKSIRPRHVAAVILFESVWNGLLGVAGDWSFRMLNALFGDGRDLATVLMKAAADQFVWTTAFIAPANAVVHFWVGRDFSFRRARSEWPKRFYLDLVSPNLVSNWCVWLPVQMTVFLFPLDLQIHMNGLVCSFWTLMCLQIGVRTR